MDHKLRVLIRINIDQTSALILVHGSLTEANHSALRAIIHRAQSLTLGLGVCVALTGAKHIEPSAAQHLQEFSSKPTNDGYTRRSFRVITPEIFPRCTASDAAAHRMLVAA